MQVASPCLTLVETVADLHVLQLLLKYRDPEIKTNIPLSSTQLIYLLVLQNSQHREAPPG